MIDKKSPKQYVRRKQPATAPVPQLTSDEMRALYEVMKDLFTHLKSDWESRPENHGKKVTYGELWEQFCVESGIQVKPLSPATRSRFGKRARARD